MFADPQSVTIDSVAVPLPRVGVGEGHASYSNEDGTVGLTVSHLNARNGRTRRMARLDVSKVSADPFVANTSKPVSSSVYLVIDEPADGSYTNAELLAKAKGLLGWLTDANVTKLLAGES